MLKSSKFITQFLKFIFIKPAPKPIANLIFNIISGKLFPKFNIVIAIKEFGIFIIFAKSFNKDIKILQENKIHNIDMKRPNKDNKPKCFGSFFGSVFLKI